MCLDAAGPFLYLGSRFDKFADRIAKVSRQSEWATRAKRAQQDWPVNMEIDLRESVAIGGESGSATAAWNKVAFRSTGFAGCMQTSL